MTTWGDARVSTLHQDPAPQVEALRQAGVSGEHLVGERMSGATKDRPGLAGLLEQARPGWDNADPPVRIGP
ncbi:recombinase family protein [Aestuariimicrobium kwangyangense]|uniref:recombinase family protein n=1 Tax=Aestuariimicrobium kwangyangense TaxID=396389 RepID=UPI000A030FD5